MESAAVRLSRWILWESQVAVEEADRTAMERKEASV